MSTNEMDIYEYELEAPKYELYFIYKEIMNIVQPDIKPQVRIYNLGDDLNPKWELGILWEYLGQKLKILVQGTKERPEIKYQTINSFIRPEVSFEELGLKGVLELYTWLKDTGDKQTDKIDSDSNIESHQLYSVYKEMMDILQPDIEPYVTVCDVPDVESLAVVSTLTAKWLCKDRTLRIVIEGSKPNYEVKYFGEPQCPTVSFEELGMEAIIPLYKWVRQGTNKYSRSEDITIINPIIELEEHIFYPIYKQMMDILKPDIEPTVNMFQDTGYISELDTVGLVPLLRLDWDIEDRSLNVWIKGDKDNPVITHMIGNDPIRMLQGDIGLNASFEEMGLSAIVPLYNWVRQGSRFKFNKFKEYKIGFHPTSEVQEHEFYPICKEIVDSINPDIQVEAGIYDNPSGAQDTVLCLSLSYGGRELKVWFEGNRDNLQIHYGLSDWSKGSEPTILSFGKEGILAAIGFYNWLKLGGNKSLPAFNIEKHVFYSTYKELMGVMQSDIEHTVDAYEINEEGVVIYTLRLEWFYQGSRKLRIYIQGTEDNPEIYYSTNNYCNPPKVSFKEQGLEASIPLYNWLKEGTNAEAIGHKYWPIYKRLQAILQAEYSTVNIKSTGNLEILWSNDDRNLVINIKGSEEPPTIKPNFKPIVTSDKDDLAAQWLEGNIAPIIDIKDEEEEPTIYCRISEGATIYTPVPLVIPVDKVDTLTIIDQWLIGKLPSKDTSVIDCFLASAINWDPRNKEALLNGYNQSVNIPSQEDIDAFVNTVLT